MQYCNALLLKVTFPNTGTEYRVVTVGDFHSMIIVSENITVSRYVLNNNYYQ